MDLFTRVEAVIALAEGVHTSADVSAPMRTASREETSKVAVSFGASADRASRIAIEADRALVEFADALVAAGQAAEKVNAVAKKHTDELRTYAQSI
jgi:hypothetical protein